MPMLIRELAVSGARKSDGTAVASGKVFLYSPGTTTLVAGFTDDTLGTAWTTVDGGIPLDAGGRVAIWIDDMIDVVVQDSDGGTVNTFIGYNKTRAEQVEIENDAYTGALTDSSGATSQAIGGKTNLDTLLTAAATSLGDDFEYQGSSGATARSYIEVITGLRISVKDFGAVGNSVADDGTAIQKALNEAKRLSATLIFEQGTYLHANALTLDSATGVVIEGRGNAVLRSSNTGANNLALTGCTSCQIRNLGIDYSSTSTGTALTATTCNGMVLDTLSLSNSAIDIEASGSNFALINVSATSATSRALRSAVATCQIIGGTLVSGAGIALEFIGAAARTAVLGTNFLNSSTGISFNASLSGSHFAIVGCPTLGSTTAGINATAVTIWPDIYQAGNCVRGPAELSFATGTTTTPVIVLGKEILLTASSGGAAAVTVNMPAILPSGTGAQDDLYYDFVFKNAAGGAVTWNLNASYVLSGAVAVPATAAHTIQVRFRWDPFTAKFRECSRGDTVT